MNRSKWLALLLSAATLLALNPSSVIAQKNAAELIAKIENGMPCEGIIAKWHSTNRTQIIKAAKKLGADTIITGDHRLINDPNDFLVCIGSDTADFGFYTQGRKTDFSGVRFYKHLGTPSEAKAYSIRVVDAAKIRYDEYEPTKHADIPGWTFRANCPNHVDVTFVVIYVEGSTEVTLSYLVY